MGALEFWDLLRACLSSLRGRLEAERDNAGLGRVQILERAAWADHGAASQAMSDIGGILGVLEGVSSYPEMARVYRVAVDLAQKFGMTEDGRAALSPRLFSMHRYLDGDIGGGNFGSFRRGRGMSLEYGLGLGVLDGMFQKFLGRVLGVSGGAGASIFDRCFGEDAQGWRDAVGMAAPEFEGYVFGQMIWRYDPVLSCKRFEVPDRMKSQFARLGAEPEARRIQAEMVAGKRFELASDRAREAGIRSLRGFAMLFDLADLAPREVLEGPAGQAREGQKCLALAEGVIARMHGRMAEHWQMRLSSLFHGVGRVDGRIYDEKRFLGERAAELGWQEAGLSWKLENISECPLEGMNYIVKPGDRLAALLGRAYPRGCDRRMFLKQNPQIVQPECLEAGMRIYFPRLTGGFQESAPWPDTDDGRVYMTEDGRYIELYGDVVGPLDALSKCQKESLCHGLSRLPREALCRSVALELSDGIAIVCQNETLFVSTDENLRLIDEQWGRYEQPRRVWRSRIAAQIRGDVMVSPEIYLPLERLPGQAHRASWMATSLRRVLSDAKFLPLRLVIHAKQRRASVCDTFGGEVASLEHGDFRVLRMQPWRRLRDFMAPPIMQMEALMHVWLADLFQRRVEIAVSPVRYEGMGRAPRQCDGGRVAFAVPMGTAVYAMMRGRVVDCVGYGENGAGVLIFHHDGLYVRYEGLSVICVCRGDEIEAETMIGRSGCMSGAGEPEFSIELIHNESGTLSFGTFSGKRLDYLDVVNNRWPRQQLFETVMEG